jgi:signal transduction histidine kinase
MNPLTRRQELLRYAIAAVPVVINGAAWAWLVTHDIVQSPRAVVDIGLGVVAVVLLRWRRRYPFTVATATALLTLGSPAAIGAGLVALTSLATHRRWLRIATAAAVLWLSVVSASVMQSGVKLATQVTAIFITASIGGLIAVGFYLRSRRDLAASEQRRVAAEEREGLESARASERARIAREMHDVLAHRLSLLSLHAGALAHRSDLSPEEVRQAAGVIRANAHESLEELRSTLGALREEGVGRPQPSFADLPALLAEVREAGQQVEYSSTLPENREIPPQVGRHAFRIVQEGLTNARKHAPGARVTVSLSGGPGETIDIRVVNAVVAVGNHNPAPGGLGLIGLDERVGLLGGSLHHTLLADRFVLDASLPWGEAR